VCRHKTWLGVLKAASAERVPDFLALDGCDCGPWPWRKHNARSKWGLPHFDLDNFMPLGHMLCCPQLSWADFQPTRIRSCPKCATDYKIEVREIEGVKGRVVVMTVWKDLGGPGSGDETRGGGLERWKWDSHRRFPTAEATYDTICISRLAGRAPTCLLPVGGIAKAFEMPLAGSEATDDLLPLIEPLAVKVLKKPKEFTGARLVPHQFFNSTAYGSSYC
jgi:hypothetical protein